MALIIFKDRIEISIPNSEAVICAQHNGIKDRTVGSYYMSDCADDVINFLNHLQGNFYIDFNRTLFNIEKMYQYIMDTDKQEIFKSQLMDQFISQAEIEENGLNKYYVKIEPPTVNNNKKYLKLNRNIKEIELFQNLLLGDVCKIIFYKLSEDCFVIFGDADENYEYKIDGFFKYK